jgi:hypothetical protein
MSIQDVALAIADLLLGPDIRTGYRIQFNGMTCLKIGFGEVTVFAALPDLDDILGESSALSEASIRQLAPVTVQRMRAIDAWIADPKFKVTKIFATIGESSMRVLKPLAAGGREEPVVEMSFGLRFGSEAVFHEAGHAVLWPHELSRSKLWHAVHSLRRELAQSQRVDFTVNGTPQTPHSVGFVMFDPAWWAPELGRSEHPWESDASELWASAFEAYNYSLPKLRASIERAKAIDPAVAAPGDDMLSILETLDPGKANGAGLNPLLDRILARLGNPGPPPVGKADNFEVGTLQAPTIYRYLQTPELMLRDGGRELP